MKKVFLLFVLSFVSVFSISAQPNNLSADNLDASDTKIESAQTSVKKDETEDLDFQKTRLSAVNVPSTATSAKASEVKAVASFTTGDANIDAFIRAACARYNVDPLLIFAQMSQESSFRKRATSSKGASGLMQLMPATAARFGVSNIYNPKQNIEAGVKYMRWLLDEFGGDVKLALAGYNAGEGAVKKFGNRIPPYRETQNYVARITAHYDRISNNSDSD